MGDPAGIGPEICAKAVSRLKGTADLTVIGDSWVYKKACLGRNIRGAGFVDLANVDRKAFSFGRISAACGRASMEYLDAALALLAAGELDCLVTCPISKEAIDAAGFHYAGHTGYLAQQTGSEHAVMMLMNKELKFTLVTQHIALDRVAASLDTSRILDTILATGRALRDIFALRSPRMVVCGINPHGSDNGVIGDHESRIIAPAVRRARSSFAHTEGPKGADVAIAQACSGLYDGIVAMYHDQALIPLKLLGDKSGVNMTLGLPFVRTSPLHGTAFDIAGKDKACPDSTIAAITTACRCALNLKKA
jgi:4-hydroxythreonine-4-phosphate dehydrogenase